MASAVTAPVHTTVIGVFDYLADARAAVEDLRRAGFADKQIGFIGPDRRAAEKPKDPESNVEEGAGIGAAVGAAAAGVAGLAVAAGLLTPIGPAIAGGALIAWLAGLGAGAAAGAAIGSLIGLGIPEEDARWYESELKAGRTLVTVQHADERSDEARELIRDRNGSIRQPSEIGTYGTGLPATPF